MKYLGVSRAEMYSPGRVSGDAAVFRAVAAELERHGHEVICMTEQDLVSNGIPAGVDGIFQMTRSREALTVLDGARNQYRSGCKELRPCGSGRTFARDRLNTGEYEMFYGRSARRVAELSLLD